MGNDPHRWKGGLNENHHRKIYRYCSAALSSVWQDILSEERMLLFDEELMTFAMGNCITLEDTNGNRKLLKKRYEQKIDAVAAMMDAFVAYKLNKDVFE